VRLEIGEREPREEPAVSTGHASDPALIHLQWFSDDAEAEGKTEQPTEHKLRKLREEEGQVPKSQELGSAATLLLPALLLLFMGPRMLRICVEMFQFFLTRATEFNPVQDAVIVVTVFRYMAQLVLPIMAISVVAAIVFNYVQIGPLFVTKPITPDFTKIIPRFGQFVKRIFSMDGVWNFWKSIIKMLIIGGVAFMFIRMDFERLANLQRAGLWLGITTIATLAIRMLITCAVLLLLFSIPDFIFQRWRFKDRNKMAKHEIKEEMKMYEGDPQIKNRIRGRFRDLMKQNISATVPRADVVITNPTHFAVALQYDKDTMPSPMVTAKGADNLAAQIRKLAEENGVPLVENKPLARALYNEVDVGVHIPRAYFAVVGTILARVYHINERRRREAAAKAAAEAAERAAERADGNDAPDGVEEARESA